MSNMDEYILSGEGCSAVGCVGRPPRVQQELGALLSDAARPGRPQGSPPAREEPRHGHHRRQPGRKGERLVVVWSN